MDRHETLVVTPEWVVSERTKRHLSELEDGLSRPQGYITVVNTNDGDRIEIPIAVNQWLETIPKSVAMLMVEKWYASEK